MGAHLYAKLYRLLTKHENRCTIALTFYGTYLFFLFYILIMRECFARTQIILRR